MSGMLKADVKRMGYRCPLCLGLLTLWELGFEGAPMLDCRMGCGRCSGTELLFTVDGYGMYKLDKVMIIAGETCLFIEGSCRLTAYSRVDARKVGTLCV